MGFSASGLARSLTLNAVQTFGTIDPAKMTDYTQYLAVVNLYDDLVYASPSGKIIPHLASSWTVGDGGKAYTFKIRPGIRFHDGMPLTAADVVYSMRRLLAIDQGPAFLWQGVLKPSGVTQVGSNQVRFTLIHPYSPFLATLPLLFVLNEKQLVKHQKSGPYGKWGDYGQSWLLNHDAGSGPYTLRTFVDGSQVTFQRFAGYWMGWPKGAFNTVNVIFTNNDSTVLSLARTGRLQLTSQFQAPETYKTLASFPNWKVVKAPSNTIFYLKLNTQKPPTDSRRVRWAIAYAIHYATIQHSLYPGAAPRGLLAPPGSAFSNPNIPELHQDLAKAKAELAKSRYAGKKLHITLTYVAGTAFEQQVALLLQSDLAKIGIQVSIVPAPWNRITQLATSKSQTPNASEVFFGPTYPSPNSVFYTQYDSNAPHTWASMAWLHDPQVNRLIVQAQDASGFAQQKAIYDKLQAILFRLMPDVPLVVQTYEYGMLKSIHGYTYNPIQSFDMNFHNLYWAP
jgi:peptide/nickel transport system substrate-binding protein